MSTPDSSAIPAKWFSHDADPGSISEAEAELLRTIHQDCDRDTCAAKLALHRWAVRAVLPRSRADR